MTEISLKSVSLSNDEDLGYRECGKSEKTIILIHGTNSSSKHWDIIMEKLMLDFSVIAIDLRGFGNSTYNEPISKIKDLSDDLLLFIQSLKLEKFTVIGWSAGGTVAMQFSIDYPEYVDKLILVNSIGIKGYTISKYDETGKIIPDTF